MNEHSKSNELYKATTDSELPMRYKMSNVVGLILVDNKSRPVLDARL